MYDSVVPRGFYKPHIWYVSTIPCTCDTVRLLQIPRNSELSPGNIFLQAFFLLAYTRKVGGGGVGERVLFYAEEGKCNLRFKNPRAHNWRQNCVYTIFHHLHGVA